MDNEAQKEKNYLKLLRPLRRPVDTVAPETVIASEAGWIRERRKKAELSTGDPSKDAVGMSISGGGIRAAIFGLGLLQSLERYKLLKHVDYLSTVSGGGYIGSALTWFKSEYGTFPFGTRRSDHDGPGGKVLHWLRTHGSYLSPGSGLTGWALGGAVAMGMLVNVLIVVPLILLFFYGLSQTVVVTGKTLPLLGIAAYLGVALILLFGVAVMTIAVIPRAFAEPNREKAIRVWLGRGLKAGILLVLFGLIPFLDDFLCARLLRQWIPSLAGTISGGAAILAALRGRTEQNENKRWRSFLLAAGLLVLLYALCLGAFHLRVVWANVPLAFGSLIVLAALGVFLSAYADINMVSMHRFYRDRLRTAFIDLPAVPVSGVQPKATKEDEERRRGYLSRLRRSDAPYHLINTILQTVGSKDPKLAGRGGDNFILSSLYCGSASTGYCSTATYNGGIMDLATAMAISGAAVDPNTYMTRKTGIRVLMTLLNLRLGYWINNPRLQSPSWNWLTRPFWWDYVIREARGKLDETSTSIHLSDGGGFENLGMYELIRRQCRVIIVCDATEDLQSAFSELAKSIELVRVDFGTKIEIHVDDIISDTAAIRRAKSAYTTGRIIYDDTEESAGTLIYINTALTEGLMADLYSYARMNPCFPEESTVDQYFDERQFEAYRELGYQIGKQLCQGKEWKSPAELIAVLRPATPAEELKPGGA
jgi:hypothetical protein